MKTAKGRETELQAKVDELQAKVDELEKSLEEREAALKKVKARGEELEAQLKSQVSPSPSRGTVCVFLQAAFLVGKSRARIDGKFRGYCRTAFIS